jgi:hypothetical protein
MTHTLNLMIHCGAQRTTLKALREMPTPKGTRTHIPIAHHELFDLTRKSAKNHGLEITQTAHATQGDLYFAMMEVRSPYDDFSSIIGLRNSHNKKLPAALVAGTGVIVCDNLLFDGTIKIGRRHTLNMMKELPNLIDTAMSQLVERSETQVTRFDRYKDAVLKPEQVNDILIAAFDAGVISSGKIGRVLAEYRQPSHKEFIGETLWTLLNAFTEILKPRESGQDIFYLSDKTVALTDLLDEVVN